MKVLLDSNAYAQLMRGREQISRIVRGAEEVLLSAIVLGGASVRISACGRDRVGSAEGRAQARRVMDGKPDLRR